MTVTCSDGLTNMGDSTVTCTGSDTFSSTEQPSCWKTEGVSVLINYDMEAAPLQIRTAPTVKDLVIKFDSMGGVDRYLDLGWSEGDQMYYVGWCTASLRPFLNSVHSESRKIWTVTKTATSLIVESDGVEVMNYLFASVDQSDKAACIDNYAKQVSQILFQSNSATALPYRTKFPGKLNLNQHI